MRFQQRVGKRKEEEIGDRIEEEEKEVEEWVRFRLRVSFSSVSLRRCPTKLSSSLTPFLSKYYMYGWVYAH